jgi:hypothetical protein
MIRRGAQETTPLVVQDDVEAGPAQYGANTPPTGDALKFLVSLTLPEYTTCTGKRTKMSDSQFARKVRYYVPSIAWIPAYSFSL